MCVYICVCVSSSAWSIAAVCVCVCVCVCIASAHIIVKAKCSPLEDPRIEAIYPPDELPRFCASVRVEGDYTVPVFPIAVRVETWTSHPGVLGSIPKREEPGKTGAPCVKVPSSSRVPIIPVAEEQSRTRGNQSRGVEDQPQCPGLWHSSSPSARSLSRSPPSFFHTIFLPPAFTSARWAD